LMENPYQPIGAVIEDIIVETPTIKTFTLRPEPPMEFKAGQFIELTVPGIGEAPFTPSSSPYVKETLDVTVMEAGTVTSALHNMKPQEVVWIRGPYGLGYTLDEFVNKEILIVGGGVGLAPLRSLFLAIIHDIDKFRKVSLRYGARTPADRVYKSALKEWEKLDKVEVVNTVDVGDETWTGNVGLVTSILEDMDIDISNSIAIVCGPPIMMRFVTFKLLEAGYKPEDIYLSMEKNMSCRIGKCGHCRIGNYYVCKDGPVFTYDKLKAIPDPF